MKQSVKKILILISVLIFVFIITMGIIVKNWVRGLDRVKLNTVTEHVYVLDKSPSSIEAESYYNPKLLLAYDLFSQGPENIEKKIFNLNYASDEILLNPLFSNFCEDIYCYQSPMKFEEIPSLLWRGLIGVEDLRFIKHQGVDFISIARALYADIKAMSFVQGGSTLTMQLVKNLFLSREKSIKRKLKEMVYAIYIEYTFSKEEILTSYFNETFWGALQGIKIKGLRAASFFYFSKKPKELTAYETGILISLLKGPNYYHPIRRTERLKSRVNVIVKKLVENGLIYLQEDELWKENKWNEWVENLKRKNKDKIYHSMWKTLKSKESSLSRYESLAFHYSVEETKKFLGNRIKDKDIGIKAIIGEIDCEECRPFYFYSKPERSKSIAIEKEIHQTGSIFKPLIYNHYLANGIQFSDTVSTDPITLNLISGRWTPKDASKAKEKEILIRDALMKSRNIPTIRLASRLGFQPLEETMEEFFEEDLKKPLAEFPAQLIGAIEIPVLKVFNVYSKFLKRECSKENRSVSLIINALSTPSLTTIRRVVSRKLKNHRFFGKTGTTNNGLDSWYVAYDGKQIYVLWMGLEGNRKDEKLVLSGASGAFRVFQNFLLNRGKRFHELHCIDEI